MALKAMQPQMLTPVQVERFTREAKTAGRVSGRFTARILDSGVDGNLPYLVMEYLDGPSLDQYCLAEGPLSSDAAERLVLALAEALAAMHVVNVVHRDLKPSNVILTEAGPRVVDFGVSYEEGAVTLTEPAHVIGTMAYLATELLLGLEPQGTRRSDVWSWGLSRCSR